MTRKEKHLEEVIYQFTRVEILDAMRDVVQQTHLGGALIPDKRNHRQRCDFVDSVGHIVDVYALVISTIYEEPVSTNAVDPVDRVGTK